MQTQTKASPPKRKCAFWFCGEDHYAHGYCVRHARQWERKGDPLSGTDARLLYEHSEQLMQVLQALSQQAIRLIEGSAGGYRMCMLCGALEQDASLPLAHHDGCALSADGQAQVLINMH